jgi:hypothetical protein
LLDVPSRTSVRNPPCTETIHSFKPRIVPSTANIQCQHTTEPNRLRQPAPKLPPRNPLRIIHRIYTTPLNTHRPNEGHHPAPSRRQDRHPVRLAFARWDKARPRTCSVSPEPAATRPRLARPVTHQNLIHPDKEQRHPRRQRTYGSQRPHLAGNHLAEP